MLYQLSLLHAVLCGKAEESHACMPMEMEQLAVLSVLRPNEIQGTLPLVLKGVP